MTPQLLDSLRITAIGMGLVFLAILALWGIMELLVQMTIRRIRSEVETIADESEPEDSPLDLGQPNRSLHLRAAAAAVAVALALESTKTKGASPNLLPAPKEQISAWQSLMRSSQLNQRSSLFNRNPRGRVR